MRSAFFAMVCLGVGGILILAACRGGRVKDPCSLLTKADVEAVVGESFEEPVRMRLIAGFEQCIFAASSDPGNRRLEVWTPGSQSCAETMKNFRSSPHTVVGGIGDEAADDKVLEMLWVRQESSCFAVSYQSAGDPRGREVREMLARKALEQLPR